MSLKYGQDYDGRYQEDNFDDDGYEDDYRQDDYDYSESGSEEYSTADYGEYDEYDDHYDNGYHRSGEYIPRGKDSWPEDQDAEDDYYADERYEDIDRYERAGDEYDSGAGRSDDGYDEPCRVSYEDDYEDGYRDKQGRYDDQYEQDRYEETDDDDESEKKPRRRKVVLYIIEAAALVVVLAILYLVTRVEQIDKVELETEVIEENISETVKEATETGEMKGYRNIVLFGVDSTEGDLVKNTRSDAIIIASVNEDTGDVKLVSVYRDTLLNLSNNDYNKCNSAYAKGGPQMAINMLNMNLDMNITDYVTVGFGGLTDVVDALGGIEVNIEEDEISHLNNYQSTMAGEINYRGNGTYDEVTQPGLQTLNGLQATAYCRIRYTYGWDYKRAARQREVIYATVAKAKTASPAQLASIANNVFGEISTSLELTEIEEYVSLIQKYNFAQEDTDQMRNGFPQEEQRIQANLGGALGDCVIPRDLENNVVWLHQFLFDEENYEVSDTVKACSDYIADISADAVPEVLTEEDHT